MRYCILLIATLLLSSCGGGTDSPDEKEIRKKVSEYREAFNSKDAKALAALWATDTEYVSPDTGISYVGRDAIQEMFETLFEDEPDVKLDVTTESIEIVENGLAVERGNARVVVDDGDEEDTQYQVIYVKEDGEWLIGSLSEVSNEPLPSHYENLKSLEWLVGDWMDADDHVAVETHCEWSYNKNFLQRTFTVSFNDRPSFEGRQVIGWDPASNKVRAWLFSSSGGYGSGEWTQEGDRWVIQATHVHANGQRSSATHIVTRIDEDTMTWQSVNRELGGEIQPNLEEITIVRKAGGAS